MNEADRKTATGIVKRCGLRDGLFKGPRTPNAVEAIAYALAAARAEQKEVDAKKCEAIADTLSPLGIGRKVSLECAAAIREQE